MPCLGIASPGGQPLPASRFLGLSSDIYWLFRQPAPAGIHARMGLVRLLPLVAFKAGVNFSGPKAQNFTLNIVFQNLIGLP